MQQQPLTSVLLFAAVPIACPLPAAAVALGLAFSGSSNCSAATDLGLITVSCISLCPCSACSRSSSRSHIQGQQQLQRSSPCSRFLLQQHSLSSTAAAARAREAALDLIVVACSNPCSRSEQQILISHLAAATAVSSPRCRLQLQHKQHPLVSSAAATPACAQAALVLRVVSCSNHCPCSVCSHNSPRSRNRLQHAM